MTAKPATVMHRTHGSGVQPLAGQPVAVRRLWPGLYPDETFELPAEQADAAIASGLVFPMMPDGDHITAGPLAPVIRSRLAADGELTGLARATTAYAQRTKNVGLLHTVVTAVPGRIAPAGFTPDRFRADYGEPPWYDTPPSWNGCVRDPRAALLVEHIDRRRAELLVEVFDNIRHGRLIATGLQAATGGRTRVPGDVWWSEAATVDMRTSGLLVGEATVFCGVEVRSPAAAARAPFSETIARRFISQFAQALEASGRVFSTAEVTTVLQREYPNAPMTSAKQIARLLRELRPAGWANGGRRPIFQVPSASELAAATDAARQETRP